MSLTPSEQSNLKETLLDMKQKLETQISQREPKESLSESTGEISSYDNHFGDIGSELNEREVAMAIDENQEETLQEVNEALQRMEKGTYGICIDTGEEISYERLKALPYAKRTVEAQEKVTANNATYETKEESFERRGERHFEDHRMQSVDEMMNTHGNTSNKGEESE
ncbi:hypothetical protein A374_08049 [Fictibacillus macauensis ZFHKF-1]|uniref:Zinc finger DksA/TraR C4-type domain-containing protein n=1 Tax=Fictibacillus macauensis ZFHKF-1 TaxID=1196324 RepID=I8J1Z5_9BACL|nr:TraR/DksA C4-type zinc finger protein [Fictibacillus macauensis]EIT85771.1 hypothetical protein A374_08049 [Fictibacillus macauensis ZFHKF-1]